MSRTKDFGVISGRLLELSSETNRPTPYVVTDKLTVAPPTRKRGVQMTEARTAILITQSLLSGALDRAGSDKPPHPGADASESELADWERAAAEWEVDADLARTQMTELSQTLTEWRDKYDRAFFGAVYDDLILFFDDQDQALWDAFVEDIRKHFYPPETPPDGACATCGTIVDDEDFLEPASSTT